MKGSRGGRPTQDGKRFETSGWIERWSASFWVSLGAAILSGLAISASFPPLRVSWIAWIALVPLFVLAPGWGWLRATGFFFVAGWISSSFGLAWIYRLAPAGGVGVAIYVGAFWAALGPISSVLGRVPGRGAFLGIGAAAVALDFVRSRFLSGFPWLFLGHTQVDHLALVQIADLCGVYGVTFLLVATSAHLAQRIRSVSSRSTSSGRLAAWLGTAGWVGLLGIVLLYGAWRLSTIEVRPGPQIVAIQADIDVLGKQGGVTAEQILRKHHELSLRATAMDSTLDLVIWPETMAPALFDDDPSGVALYRRLVEDYDASLLVGLESLRRREGGGLARRNRAFFMSRSSGEWASYDKVHLVPFGETMPLGEWFPFHGALEEMMRRRMGLVPSLTAGTETPLFDLQAKDGETYRFGALICYDSVFARLMRRYPHEDTDFFVNLSNDGWYLGTAQPQQILDITVFRSIETRRTMVRVANLGLSAIISPRGEVGFLPPPRGPGAPLSPGHGTVPVCEARSPYSMIGECFAWLCVLAAVGGVGRGVRRAGPRGAGLF